MVSDSHSEDQDRQENRPFIKETVITEEQKPSLGKKLLQTSLLALCFGVIAAFAFHIVHTRLDPSPEETSSAAEPISFPEDTDPAETSESQSSGPSGTTAVSQPSSYSDSESGRPWSGWREDVNALIGAQHKILILLEDENGTLTL